MDRDNVLVLDAGRRPGLAQEALAGLRVGGQRRDHRLDRDHAAQIVVLSPEHDPHAATTQHLQNAILPDPAELARDFRRRSKSDRRVSSAGPGRSSLPGLVGASLAGPLTVSASLGSIGGSRTGSGSVCEPPPPTGTGLGCVFRFAANTVPQAAHVTRWPMAASGTFMSVAHDGHRADAISHPG